MQRSWGLVMAALLAGCDGGTGGGGADTGGRADTGAAPDARSAVETRATPDTARRVDTIPGVFSLASAAFEDGGAIPPQYACSGQEDLGLSPALSWSNPPAGTVAFALTCVDPDGGDWVHWLAWDLPADLTALPEGLAPDAVTGVQGMNDFGKPGYGGPCPPPNGPHHYVFTLYALDAEAALDPATAKIPDLLAFAASHTLGTATLTGLFENPGR